MFDARLRTAYAPLLDRTARAAHRRGVRALPLTATGLVLGLAAAGCAALSWWWAALACWLVSRLVDGLDGTVARLEGATARGGFVDLVADFTVYAAFVAGVAVAVPEARLAAVVLLCTYYVSAAAFLAWSAATATTTTTDASTRADAAVAEPSGGLAVDDNRTIRFVGGLAEGFETIVAYALICLLPHRADLVLWGFAALVGVTALQRIRFAVIDLGRSGRT